MKPKVSIITPCYNSSGFLRSLWQSLVDQQYPELEWIVVDDHSSDNSLAVLQALQSEGRLPMQVLTNPRKGACAARNFGLAHCSGDWVKFLDSDDLLASGHIRAFVPAMESLPADARLTLIGNTQFFFEVEGKPTTYQNTAPQRASETDTLRHFISQASFHHSACLIPRAAITPDNLWNEALLADQDGNFLSRLFLTGVGGKIVDTPPFIYRQHDSPDRITARESAAKLESRITSVEDIIDTMKKHGNYDAYKESVAQKYEKIALRAAKSFPDIAHDALRRANEVFPGYRSTQPLRRRLTQRLFGIRSSALVWEKINQVRMRLRHLRN